MYLILILVNQTSFKVTLIDTSEILEEIVSGDNFDRDLQPFNIQDQPIEVDQRVYPPLEGEDEPNCDYSFYLRPSEDHFLVMKSRTPAERNPHDIEKGDNVLVFKENHRIFMGILTEKPCAQEADMESPRDVYEVDFEDAVEKAELTPEELDKVSYIYLHVFNEPREEIYDYERAFFSHRRVRNIIEFEINNVPELFKDDFQNEANKPALADFDVMEDEYLAHLSDVVHVGLGGKFMAKLTAFGQNLDDQDSSSFIFIPTKSSTQSAFFTKYKKPVEKIFADYGKKILDNNLMMGTLNFYYNQIARKHFSFDHVRQAMNDVIEHSELNMILETLWDMYLKGMPFTKGMGFFQISKNPDELVQDDKFNVLFQFKETFIKKITEKVHQELDENQDVEVEDPKTKMMRTIVTEMYIFEAHLDHIVDDLMKQLEEVMKDDSHLLAGVEDEMRTFLIKEANFNSFLVKQLLNEIDEVVNRFIDTYWEVTMSRTFVPETFISFPGNKIDINKLYLGLSYFQNAFLFPSAKRVKVMDLVEEDEEEEISPDQTSQNQSENTQILDKESGQSSNLVDDLKVGSQEQSSHSNSQNSSQTGSQVDKSEVRKDQQSGSSSNTGSNDTDEDLVAKGSSKNSSQSKDPSHVSVEQRTDQSKIVKEDGSSNTNSSKVVKDEHSSSTNSDNTQVKEDRISGKSVQTGESRKQVKSNMTDNSSSSSLDSQGQKKKKASAENSSNTSNQTRPKVASVKSKDPSIDTLTSQKSKLAKAQDKQSSQGSSPKNSARQSESSKSSPKVEDKRPTQIQQKRVASVESSIESSSEVSSHPSNINQQKDGKKNGKIEERKLGNEMIGKRLRRRSRIVMV